jgi:sugar (pentulose or hexulose) kinase
MRPLVAVDVGTTCIRAARWDETGACVQVATQAAPALLRLQGRVEQPVKAMLTAVDRVVADVCGEKPCVVALTSQRATTVLIDALGEPLTPLISWQDRRPGGIAAWFGEQLPDVAQRAMRQASIASLLVHRWTGEWAEHSATRAERSLGRPTSEATEALPCTAGPFAKGSTLVAVGGDKNCELVGAGATSPGRCAVSFGTALSMGTLVASDAAVTPGTFRTRSAFLGLDTLEVGLVAGGVMAPQLGGPHTDVCLPPVGGVMCVPYFGGSLLNLEATGCFVGMSTSVDMDQLYAAWLESLVLELMLSSPRLGTIDGPIEVCGGGATAQFSQWLATGLQSEILHFHGSECGLFGAALVALRFIGSSTRVLRPLPHRLFRPIDDRRWKGRLIRYSRLVREIS